MEKLAALPVVLPFGIAGLIAATHRLLPRRALDLIATLTSATVCGLCVALAEAAADGPLVHWFGNWVPAHGEPLGIAFVVQPIGAGLAVLTALLVTSALVFSWRFFDDMSGLYHAIILVFLGGMCGFCLTGDLFNLFVFYEVMGVSAFALTGYKNNLRGAIQGAIAFAITNSFAAILLLLGLTLVYAQTGSLNLARAGEVLASRPLDAVTLTAFALIAAGLLTKAGQFPFHLWVADAHTVAPIPANVILAGAMGLLGYWGLAHVYWIVFEGALAAHEDVLRDLLVVLAIASGAVGALSALLQADLKRILAFSIVAHGAPVLAGIALLSPSGLGGAAIHLFGEGLLEGSLFLIAGRLLNQHGSTNIQKLHGRGRGDWIQATLFFVATLGLSGIPGSLTWAGESFIEEAAKKAGLEWLRYPVLLAPALVGVALLAAGGAIYFGWGPRVVEESGGNQHASDDRGEQPVTPEMLVIPAVLVALSFALTFVGDLGSRAERWSAQLTHPEVTAAKVLRGEVLPAHVEGALHLEPKAVITGIAVGTLVLLLGAGWLLRHKLPHGLRRAARLMVTPVHALQSGDVCDYLLWMSAGLAAFGAVLVFAIGV